MLILSKVRKIKNVCGNSLSKHLKSNAKKYGQNANN